MSIDQAGHHQALSRRGFLTGNVGHLAGVTVGGLLTRLLPGKTRDITVTARGRQVPAPPAVSVEAYNAPRRTDS